MSDSIQPNEKQNYKVIKPAGRPDLMTFAEARAYLRVGESTLRSYVRTGRVTAYRLAGGRGRLLFFRQTDLDALLEVVVPAQNRISQEAVALDQVEAIVPRSRAKSDPEGSDPARDSTQGEG